MKNQLSLNIKTPCQENFNKFAPTPKGGFCGSCEKEVIDFTKFENSEIAKYFKTENKQDTCGRFKASQLNTPSPIPQQRKRYSLLTGIGLACLSLFTFNMAQAQDAKTISKTSDSDLAINTSKFKNNILVKGNISEDSLPLPGVNILLEGTGIGTTSDFDGNFTFPQKLKKGDVLIFSSVGMDSQKIVIESKDASKTIDLKVNMEMDSVILMGKIAVKEVYKSNRTK
ncbi:carboxypeptidase-like regulatory domain-containing protein [uncultured Lacinutrix sp.]|uniref:carboxypeptidase-like regulatory domain-containing protein n=1 Tax=uncultured Lacinutrix sp. TaxID=574032 RepID=UPI00263694E3|nr:carboxypeptidase-like regulatory domain-containing protein [uncultured Lacinutrix sp.]